jgi:carboxyl-terminal processing protease
VVEALMKSVGDKFVKVLLGAALILVIAVVGVGAFILGRESDSNSSSAAASSSEFDYSVLNEVKRILERDYVKPDNLDEEALFEAAVNGMVGLLNDNGTYYVTPTDHQLDTTISGSFDGIGATISSQNNDIVIVAPIKGTPAEAAGLKSGDVILAVDGESTKGWTVEKTVLRIRGPKGTQVTIEIKHDDGKTQEYKLTRSTVQVDSVLRDPPGGAVRDSSGAIVDGIGYVQIREFSRRTPMELENAIRDEVAEGAKGMIIDVRSNPGGLLQQTLQMADLFLDKGTLVIQRDRSGNETTSSAEAFRRGQIIADMPIVVLQNRFSASASEILASALRDNGRATIVGEKSFGKGTVNIARQLDNGGAVYVSIAQWLTPSGALIDKVGILPDVEVIPTDEDVDLRRDPQFYRAVDILRSKIRLP